MSRHVKRLLIVLVAFAALLAIATVVYVKFIHTADDEFSAKDVNTRLDECADGTGTTDGSASGADGTWTIGCGSEVGYRVNERINGLDTEANGRTKAITGSITIEGTTADTAQFTVDMTTFKSSESRRDGQFNGRIMQVDQFPTSTFTLTQPIDFQQVPTEGGSVTATATGDLTLHGVTKSVTFELTATFKNGRIGILGQIPVSFADYSIGNPSFATVTTEDHGLLEFVLVLDRA